MAESLYLNLSFAFLSMVKSQLNKVHKFISNLLSNKKLAGLLQLR